MILGLRMNGHNKSPSRILVFRVGHLGDTVVALPALWAIREAFPHAHITLLSNHYSVSDRVSPNHVVPSEGLIDDYLNYPSNDRRNNVPGLLWLWLLLRRRRFDTLVYLAPRLRQPRSVRRDLRFFKLAGIHHVLAIKDLSLCLPGTELNLSHLLNTKLTTSCGGSSLSEIPIPEGGEVNIDLANRR